MRFSIWPSSAHSWGEILTLAQHAEATGWDGVYIADHFMPNSEDVSGPMQEALTVLAGLAAVVPRVRLASLLFGNTYRHPAVLAKSAVTIDHISGGRFALGLGAGWQENEHDAYGIELPAAGRRLKQFTEAVTIVKSLRDEHRTTVHGDHYDLTEAPLEPKPVGPMPILIGGSGERVMLRIVAEHADEWNVWSTPERMAQKSEVLARHCEAVDRDPSSIHRSTQALLFPGADGAATAAKFAEIRPAIGGTSEQLVDTVGQFVELGVDELIVPDFTLGEPTAAMAVYDQLITEVAPAFR